MTIGESAAKQLVHAEIPFRHKVWATLVSLLVCMVNRMALSRAWTPVKESGPRHSIAVPTPAPRQLSKGAGLCIRMEVVPRGGMFKGCSAAEVRLNLIPQGRLDARRKGPFDSIKGVNFPCCTLQFFILYPPSQYQSPSVA
jgi:hypothetical protein